jgi:AraC family transcriptional regulator of adaptative response/methylated-DNA-[protein]-cysteine methyltransferase
VRCAICDSVLGKILVAASERGLCKVEIGGSRAELMRSIRKTFAGAVLEPDDPELKRIMERILLHLDGKQPRLALPLDIPATAFQARVYKELQRIPYGRTRTYGELARRLGVPKGPRAVARACATNPVALAIPCHRVVGVGGALTGYRWGVERKRALLEREAGRKLAAAGTHRKQAQPEG